MPCIHVTSRPYSASWVRDAADLARCKASSNGKAFDPLDLCLLSEKCAANSYTVHTHAHVRMYMQSYVHVSKVTAFRKLMLRTSKLDWLVQLILKVYMSM